MSENWRQAYIAITDFITNHSEIKIEPSIVKIHETVRPEFYQLFWAAREAFLKERNKALLDEAEVLSKKYLQVEEELIKLIGLERISLFPRVDNFLHNPVDELIKELNNPFFNLLKGRIDIARYEKEASNNLASYFDSLYQQGYAIWITLSLIKMLEASKSFRVDVDEFDDDEYFKHGGGIEVPVPNPEELGVISFKHNPIIGILVADQIVQSAKNGHYFSFRPHIVEPEGEATNKSTKKEWLPLPVRTIIDIGYNVILVYTDKELNELSLIADSKRVCRPDLVIECVGLKKMFNENSLDKVINYHDNFKPRLGTYIISNEPIIEKIPEGQEADIHFLPVGFDQSKLEQIINLFINKENSN